MSDARLTPDEHEEAERLFEQVMSCEPASRLRALDEVPEFSTRVREEVRALLSYLPSEEFLGTPASHTEAIERVLRDVTAHEPDRLIGATLGGYRIEALLGVGGMGAVYRAVEERDVAVDGQDAQGVDRTPYRVALKVLRPHAMSPSAVSRLSREARVLARMQHPCIARMLDAGTAQEGPAKGTPYFAMELLDGAVPLNDWVHRPNIRPIDLIALFIRVCDAVHHGHQRGVIHRDLKPQNIMVMPNGKPKLIDFGVAFATDIDVSRLTVSTGIGTIVGTFAYMSPEQCEGDPAAVDTRSDIYALGVILYELLSGQRPHELDGRPLPEVLSAIREGRMRRIETIAPDYAGDMATIVHKAMAPIADDRYSSAADLSQDIGRYLTDRPIEAKPADWTHQVRLLWKRQRAAMSAGLFAAVCVVGAAIVSVLFAIEARAGEKQAVDALVLEAAARDRAERMTTFLRGAIGSANPYQPVEVSPGLLASSIDPWAEWMYSPWNFAGSGGNTKATVEDVLVGAARRLPQDFADDAAAQADLAETLGVTLFRFDRFDEARGLLTRCVDERIRTLGERNDATIRAMLRVGEVFDAVDANQAKAWYTRAHAICVEVYGPRHPRTLRAERMLSRSMADLKEDAAGLLLATVPIPAPDGPLLPPEELVHLAQASHMMDERTDPRAGRIAQELVAQLKRGAAKDDQLARVIVRQDSLATLLATGVPVSQVREQIETLERDASEIFGPWSAQYMNALTKVMQPQGGDRESEASAVYHARAAAAHLRLRGPRHWETGNTMYRVRYAFDYINSASPTAPAAAAEVRAALQEFPQSLTTPSIYAACIIAEADARAGRAEEGYKLLEGELARMRAPQAIRLYPHAWVRLHVSRGNCLRAMNRPEEAADAYRASIASAQEVPDANEAKHLSVPARAGLAALGIQE